MQGKIKPCVPAGLLNWEISRYGLVLFNWIGYGFETEYLYYNYIQYVSECIGVLYCDNFTVTVLSVVVRHPTDSHQSLSSERGGIDCAALHCTVPAAI